MAYDPQMIRNPDSETPGSKENEQRASENIGRLFEALRPDLLRFAFWLARDPSIAEDVVQEALLRAWRSRHELKDNEAARPWLLTIVRREHARTYERKRLETTSLHEGIDTEHYGIAADADGEIAALQLAILRLPATYREPLVMQVFGGFTTEEIGRELQLSPTAVLTRLCRARHKLQELYGLDAKRRDNSQDEEDHELR
jgi:RNA polymerase sigma-70 factor (ECF subfamily)